MKKVLIPTKLDKIAREFLEANGHYEVVQDDCSDLADLLAEHADTYALIVRSEKVTREVIDALPNLGVVVRAGAGYNTIDTKYARKKGIDVMNTPGANSNAVAEEVVAMMLADARHVVRADLSTREGKWEKKRFLGNEIANKTIGIVGLGNIGQLVARRLAGFEMKLLGYDPIMSRERAADIDVALTDLETLFAQSDYVTLHIPENDDTRGMVNLDLLGRMKSGATIINCARAGIVDEEALREAKKRSGIRFLNDVYPKDSEGRKSVADIADIMLPHLGASTREANFSAAKRAAEQLIDFDEKGVTSFIVNRDIPDGLDEAYCTLCNTLARLARGLLGHQYPLKRIETSAYGSLEPYGEWLLIPMLAGIWGDDFDATMDHRSAREFLDEMGVEYLNREVDPRKRFANSITVDLMAIIDGETLKRISVRGTVTEGALMISRVNEFDRMYFEPKGHTLFALYKDRPGVIGKIGTRLAEEGINIEDMRHSHDEPSNRSLAICKLNKPVSDALAEAIKREIDARVVFRITF